MTNVYPFPTKFGPTVEYVTDGLMLAHTWRLIWVERICMYRTHLLKA